MAAGDIDTAFDQIVLAEESFHDEGYKVGVEQGQLSGYQDGYKTGALQAAKLGSEIGFYEGLALAWKEKLSMEADRHRRKLKALDGLLEAIHSIPRDDPSSPTLHECVDTTRARFRQVSSLLNISATYGKKVEKLSF